MAGGAPTKYDEKYAEQAYKLCLLGATDSELADFFEVEESTINNWKHAHPEFLESLKRGKRMADANVADRLYQRATGYEHPEDKIFNDEGTPLIVPTVKHYPPDTAAAIYWLNNRQRKNWSNRIETTNQNTNLNGDLTPEQVNIVIQPMGGEAKQLPTNENDVDTTREIKS